MKEKLKYFWIILLCAGCASSKKTGNAPVIIEEKVVEKTIIKDSIIVRDSVVITPIERIVDIVPQYDTLHLQTSLAKSKAWIDTTTHTLKGEITNKKQAQNKNRTEVKYINRVDTVFIEKPIPYPDPVPYVPKIYKWSLGFSIIVLLVVFGTIIWKLKRWFV